MIQANQPPKGWALPGWFLFAGLQGSLTFIWFSVMTGHITIFFKMWTNSSDFIRVMWFGSVLAGLFLLLPQFGLTQFGREIVVLSMVWGLIFGLVGVTHVLIPSRLLHAFMVLGPMAVQAISIAILRRSLRSA